MAGLALWGFGWRPFDHRKTFSRNFGKFPWLVRHRVAEVDPRRFATIFRNHLQPHRSDMYPLALNQIDLSRTGFLRDFPVAAVDAFKSTGEGMTVSAGETIIHEGDEQNFLFILVEGRAKVLQKRVAPAVTAWLEPGESFGEVNLFDLERSGASASVVASEPCQVWRVDRDGLNRLISADPETALRLMISLAGLLSKRLRGMNELVREMSVWSRA